MAYYDALVAKWGTLAPDTTANKLAALNAITITGVVPTTFFTTGDAILNCLDWTEFASLTAAQQTTLLQALSTPGQIKGGAGTFIGSMFVAFYAGKLGGPTITALTALAKGIVTPWWQATVAQGGGGLNGPVTANDLTAAGGLS